MSVTNPHEAPDGLHDQAKSLSSLFDRRERGEGARSRADGDGHNCVLNKDRADFPPVLESGHTIAVVQGASRAQVRASSGRGYRPAAFEGRDDRWTCRSIALGGAADRLSLKSSKSFRHKFVQLAMPIFFWIRNLGRPSGRPSFDDEAG